MNKDLKFEWGDKHERAFEELKERLTTVPLLAILKSGEMFTIFSDTSYQGLGYMLMQDNKVITHSSRQLKLNELNYLIHDLELAAIVFTLNI